MSTVSSANRESVESSTPLDASERITIFLHALFFVIGFGVVFTLLGSAAGLLGASLLDYQIIVQRIGGLLLIIFGLTTLGLFFKLAEFLHQQDPNGQNPIASFFIRIANFFNALLYTERRVVHMHEVNTGWGYASSFAVGVSFSAGWIPCIGPILASILLLASNSATAVQGAILLAFYSIGLGIPFLLTALAFSTVTGVLRKLNRYLGIISILSGLFMIMMGYFLWTDQMIELVNQFAFLNEWVFHFEGAMTSQMGRLGIQASSASSAVPLAIMAGFISFISPCVLPLVPAYVGYLGGTSLIQE
ncbi:MAG: cytochrome c biogenesis protein CcdA [Chloroflexota bacterium]